ncbi:hypothetical protein [Cupriavidus taiwanensis]|uniref:hypothetical protein n=1 Tax=Cupriavidus taiwanensis TaxID=164546 RepID=UPI000E10A259|nr:hypothetical protein [Cupriavidus taiwanensis]SPA50622.1 exported protein of unknown function [Cupriavidus taiwanensis]
MKSLLVTAAVLVLAGCGTQTQWVNTKMEKPGHWRSDLQACREVASHEAGPMDTRNGYTIDQIRLQHAAKLSGYIQDCMEDRGWERQAVQKS